jgi:hypothetical protein
VDIFTCEGASNSDFRLSLGDRALRIGVADVEMIETRVAVCKVKSPKTCFELLESEMQDQRDTDQNHARLLSKEEQTDCLIKKLLEQDQQHL